jgi:hypothetical protein
MTTVLGTRSPATSAFTIHYRPTHESWLKHAEIKDGMFTKRASRKPETSRFQVPLQQKTREWNHRTNRD